MTATKKKPAQAQREELATAIDVAAIQCADLFHVTGTVEWQTCHQRCVANITHRLEQTKCDIAAEDCWSAAGIEGD